MNAVQPKPTKQRGTLIFPLVIADLQERDKLGHKLYGAELRAIDGRDHLIDLYQEILDAAVYVRQEIEERKILRDEIERLLGILEQIAYESRPAGEDFGNSQVLRLAQKGLRIP